MTLKTKKGHTRTHAVAHHIREHKLTFAVYVILRLIVGGMLILALLRRDYESAFICGLTLVLFLLPAFIQHNLGIRLPTALEILTLLFIFAAEILGELQCYYLQIPFWDEMLHTVNGFVCAAIGMALVDLLGGSQHEKFRLSPLYMAIVGFCFSMTIGVLWEFFEYGMDMLFLTDMQKDTIIHQIATVDLHPLGENKAVILENIRDVTVNGQSLGLGGYLDIGLHDTMGDLIVNFVGAAVFSVIGYFYIKYRGRGAAGQIAEQFIPTVREQEMSDS